MMRFTVDGARPFFSSSPRQPFSSALGDQRDRLRQQRVGQMMARQFRVADVGAALQQRRAVVASAPRRASPAIWFCSVGVLAARQQPRLRHRLIEAQHGLAVGGLAVVGVAELPQLLVAAAVSDDRAPRAEAGFGAAIAERDTVGDAEAIGALRGASFNRAVAVSRSEERSLTGMDGSRVGLRSEAAGASYTIAASHAPASFSRHPNGLAVLRHYAGTRPELAACALSRRAPATADLIGGRLQVLFDTLPAAIGNIRAGKIRALAVTSKKRSTRCWTCRR